MAKHMDTGSLIQIHLGCTLSDPELCQSRSCATSHISAGRPVFGTKICSRMLRLFAHDLWRGDRGLISNTPGRSYSGQSKPGFSARTRVAGKSLGLLCGNPVLSRPGFLQTGPIKMVYDRAGSFGGGVGALSDLYQKYMCFPSTIKSQLPSLLCTFTA